MLHFSNKRVRLSKLITGTVAVLLGSSCGANSAIHPEQPGLNGLIGSPLVAMAVNREPVDMANAKESDVAKDLSFAGYKASEEPIPFLRPTETLDPIPWKGEPEGNLAYPQGPDSRERIQAALDRVAAREPNEDGFKGAVFLSKGTYYINGSLHVPSGVVLRGEGQRNFGSILVFQNPGGTAITVGGTDDMNAADQSSSAAAVEGLRITSNYLKGVSDPENLRIGIHIIGTENAWVRGCRVLHASDAAVKVEHSRYVTVRNSMSAEPIRSSQPEAYKPFVSTGSTMVLFYDCTAGDERKDFIIGESSIPADEGPLETAGLYEEQLTARIGDKPAALVLAETLSKASLPMRVRFPRALVNGVPEGPISEDQIAFEAANQRSWKTVMSDDGTKDWTEQWFLDGEGSTTVTNTPDGMELKALNDHMVLWTKQSFEGDLKIDYTFTRTDVDGGGVCIIYIQATGRGDEGYEKDITEWNDYREEPGMGKYFRNMHLYHVSYACGYVRGRRYNPIERKMNTYSELTPEHFVDPEDFFEPGVPYRITFIKTDREIRMRAVGPEKILYFMLDNEKWPVVTEGRIGLRQMQSRHSLYRNFRVSVPSE